MAPTLESWRARGALHRVHGVELFAVTEGAAREGAADLVVLHGFPSCSYDYHRVLPALAAHRRVIAHDHLGFGLSAKPAAHAYSLIEQAELAIGLWQALGVRRAHLVAHDYGTSVATELLARRQRGLLPIELASVTLSNGSVHIELAHLTATQKILRGPLGPALARLSSRRFFDRQMRALFADPSRLEADELDALWTALTRDDGRARLPQLSQYLRDRVRFWHRWIGALEALDLPTLVLWGRRDPIAVPAIAERLAAEIAGARLTWLDEVGHYPMIEAPEAWATPLAAHLAAHDAAR